MAAIDRDEIDRLEELKTVNSIVTSSLQNELLLVQDKHNAVIAELEQKKNHLMEVILSNNKLLNDLAVVKDQTDASYNDGEAKAKRTVEEEHRNRIDVESLQEVSRSSQAAGTQNSSKHEERGRLSWGFIVMPLTDLSTRDLPHNEPSKPRGRSVQKQRVPVIFNPVLGLDYPLEGCG